jgi:hypothetical protein
LNSAILRSYLSFWDPEGNNDDSPLSEIETTSENELGWLLCGNNGKKHSSQATDYEAKEKCKQALYFTAQKANGKHNLSTEDSGFKSA